MFFPALTESSNQTKICHT